MCTLARLLRALLGPDSARSPRQSGAGLITEATDVISGSSVPKNSQIDARRQEKKKRGRVQKELVGD